MSKIGRFGEFGGQYIPETVMTAVHELEKAYDKYKDDPEFNKELQELYHNYAGRPSMLYYAEKMTKDLGGAKIYIKREDLNHTGSHKINNVLGQILLAKKMGKKRIIAETGAGQHGVCRADLHLGRGQRGKRRQHQCGQHRTGSRRASGKCFQFHNFPLLSWFIW